MIEGWFEKHSKSKLVIKNLWRRSTGCAKMLRVLSGFEGCDGGRLEPIVTTPTNWREEIKKYIKSENFGVKFHLLWYIFFIPRRPPWEKVLPTQVAEWGNPLRTASSVRLGFPWNWVWHNVHVQHQHQCQNFLWFSRKPTWKPSCSTTTRSDFSTLLRND